MPVRPATEQDAADLVALVADLAEYERARDQVELTEPRLRAALFGPDPVAHGLVATPPGQPSQVVGMALWFRTFSTWTGLPGIYLEDLFVRPEHRGAGHGRDLLATLAAECLRRGYRRLEWSVLDWNSPALGFYRRLGAAGLDDWTVHRLAGAALDDLAALAPAAAPDR